MKNLIITVAALSVVSLVTACGGGHDSNPSSGPQGKLTQGPVSGATVYADSLVTGSGTRFVLDAGEISTTTDAGGNFQLPTQPAFSHVLVSIGGTDTLTNQPAMQMIAPAGSANVTPLTTLVALDITGTVKAKIEALLPAGAKFDADTSIVTSQAALLLIKSCETAVQAITGAINSGGKISAAQLASLQTTVMASITSELSKESADTFVATISNPTTLAAYMQIAANGALTTIAVQNSNIQISPAVATAAAAAVATAIKNTATVLGVTTIATTTQVSGGEAAVINSTVAASIIAAVTTATTTITTSPGFTPPTVTPPAYTPPPVTVVTAPMAASISPAAGASITGGATTISISFTEAMNNNAADTGSGANPVNWLIKAGTTTINVGTINYIAASNTFTSTASLPNGATITVTVKKAVKSAAGTAMTNDYVWSFTTKPTGLTGSTGF